MSEKIDYSVDDKIITMLLSGDKMNAVMLYKKHYKVSLGEARKAIDGLQYVSRKQSDTPPVLYNAYRFDSYFEYKRFLVEKQLKSNERLLWTGEPDPSLKMASYIVILLIFVPWTLLWVILSITTFYFVIESGGDLIQPFLFLPFIALGLFFLLNPCLHRKIAKERIYGITNQRALVLNNGNKIKVETYSPSKISTINSRERNDGTGHVLFIDKSHFSDGREITQQVGFTNIKSKDIEKVRELLNQLRGS